MPRRRRRRARRRTYYVYDAAGERVRKVTEPATGRASRTSGSTSAASSSIASRRRRTVALERETLHVMDDDAARRARRDAHGGQRPASPAQLVRYQLGNHLGSVEPRARRRRRRSSPTRSTTRTAAPRTRPCAARPRRRKRYRYTGKERDEESGLYYHGARYYAPWLGRWTSCDPAGLTDGLNVLRYARNNPISFRDADGTEKTRLHPFLAS